MTYDETGNIHTLGKDSVTKYESGNMLHNLHEHQLKCCNTLLALDANLCGLIRTEQNRTLFCINISGHSQVAYEKNVYVYLVE